MQIFQSAISIWAANDDRFCQNPTVLCSMISMQQGPFYNPPSHGIMGFMKPKGSAIGLRYFTLKADLFQEQIKKSIEMMRFLFCEHPICQLLYPPIPPPGCPPPSS